MENRKTGQVFEQLAYLEKNIICTQEALETLQDRLSPILRGANPSEEKEPQKETEIVEAANRIRNLSRLVGICAATVNDITSRLEL